ncbi:MULTISPECIES: alpha/beta hydrolase [unclassified Streptomyces]|uniref:alpha/beta hydrolase n=1 Tax=unclassified Streptomyces TaxID=2593676 RepID=UPI000315A6F6|nr:alpha/beta hydrolase-fold protein [Streptomyces sp. e14]
MSPRPARHRAPAAASRNRLASLGAAATLVTVTALGTVIAPAALGAAPAAAAGQQTAADGARIVATQRLDDRTLDLTVDSPAVGKQVKARVILPANWSADATRTWPVLYLLHGGHDDYTSWTRETDVEQFLADKDVLTVMPDAGPTGLPTKWWNFGQPGDDYETFQSVELMQLLQNDYRAGSARAIAGVSTGGYGAMAMAARYPGTFGAAASYSGVLNTTDLGTARLLGTILAREGIYPDMLWGNLLFNLANWISRNPTDQASRLRGTQLYVSQGKGGGIFSQDPEGGILESSLWDQAHTFTSKLSSLGIPATVHYYDGGVHNWPNWTQEFKASWPVLAKGLGLTTG